MIRTVILTNSIPAIFILIAWIVAIVFVVRMYRRGGGRPERLLLIGVSLMLFGSLIKVGTAVYEDYLINSMAGNVMNINSVVPEFFFPIAAFRGIISLAGIICMVCAFWQKFKTTDS